jgi:WD40 repeat protein
VWSLDNGHCTARLAHPHPVTAAAISPHGRKALTACFDGVRLFDLASATVLRHLEVRECWSVCASGDWRIAALQESGTDTSGDERNSSMRRVSVWDLEQGQRVWSAPHFLASHVALEPRGRWLLSAGAAYRDGTLWLWDLTTGECVRKLKGHADNVNALAFDPSGRRALSGGRDGSARLWDVATGVCLKRFDLAGDYVHAVCFSSDESWVFTGSAAPMAGGRKLRVWEAATGRCLRTFEDDGAGTAVVGRRVISGSRAGLRVRELPDAFPPIGSLRVSRPRSQVILSEAEERVNGLLAEASASLALRAFAAALAKLRAARALPGWERSPRCLEAWSSLASFCVRTDLRAAWPARILPGYLGGVSADGRLVLTHSKEGLRLWDITDGRCVRTVETDLTTAAALSMDGRWAITAGTPPDRQPIGPHTLTLWDLSTGRAVHELVGHAMYVTRLSWSVDGRWVLSSGLDALRLWAVATGRCLRTFTGRTAVLTPDGRCALAATGMDLSLWDSATGHCQMTWEAHPSQSHTQPITALCLSTDGGRALTGGWDDCARLWDLPSGRRLAEFGEDTHVEGVALSLDGRFAFVASADKTVHVWDVATGRRGLAIDTSDAVSGLAHMALAGGGRFLLANGQSGVRVHELDWELAARAEAEWDEGARPHFETFLTLRTPVAAELSADEDATEEQIGLALTRRGRPSWTEADFADLRRTLGDAGYGWLSAEGVRRQLDRMAAERGGTGTDGMNA